MVATIPNDIFQYSLSSAFHAQSLHSGGPPAAFLTRHGTHGVGFFAPSSPTSAPDVMCLMDSTAYRITPQDGTLKKAEQHAQLPFVMVTVFEPVWRVTVPANASGASPGSNAGFGQKQLLEVLYSGNGERGGKNSYMPFRVSGTFAKVSCAVVNAGAGAGSKEQVDSEFTSVKGTIFGFYSPPWAEAVSGKGFHCAFIGSGSSSGSVGGLVREFEAEGELVVEWGICGRFHLGLPSGEEWEGLQLAA